VEVIVRERGFSLVELLCVLAGILVLCGVSLPYVKAYAVEAHLVAYCCYCCCCCCCCTCGGSCGGTCYGQYTCAGYYTCVATNCGTCATNCGTCDPYC
jgi:prepilin-type N-terminal cleavage/methylation domain-containing protein